MQWVPSMVMPGPTMSDVSKIEVAMAAAVAADCPASSLINFNTTPASAESGES